MITSDLIDQRYRIIRNIGKGAMGSVFLVHDNKLDKLWAAKLVRDISSNELLALKAVAHPAFPRLVDTVYENDYIWLIMDYMEGVSLKEYMRNIRISRGKFEDLAMQLAEAINYLHTLTPSMLYLDCKPDNIIIDKQGILHMIDLGSIYLVNESNPGRISGTAGFASPEQRLCKPLDVRSDIYSYGMTLKSIMPGPDTTGLLLSIIRKSTCPNRDKRFQSMNEIMECLKHPGLIKGLTIRRIIERFALYTTYISLTIFTIIAYNTYKEAGSLLILLLATMLLILLLAIMNRRDRGPLNTHWTCHKDIYLSRGMRTLPIILIILMGIIMSASGAAQAAPEGSEAVSESQKPDSEVAYSDALPVPQAPEAANVYSKDDYRITCYTSKNEKILYYGQRFEINPDGSATVFIPVSSLTPDSLPAKIEFSRK